MRAPEGPRVLEIVTSPLIDGHGVIVAGIEVIRDITERRQHEMLSRIELSTTAILVQAPSLEAAIPHILQNLCETIDWEIGSVWSLDKDQSLKLTALWHPPEMPAADFRQLSASLAFSRGIGLPGKVWQSNQPVWLADLAESNLPRSAEAQACGIQAGFAFPIVIAGQFAGIMEFFTTQKRERDNALRKLLQDRARQMFAAAQRHDTGVGLVFLDLNGFKQINDTLGHRTGDLVLKEFAALLLRSVRESDTVARFGGDEFIAVLAGVSGAADALVVVDKIQAALQTPFFIEQASIPVAASIGLAFYPQDGTDLEALIQSADAAMYRSKELLKTPAAVSLSPYTKPLD